MSASIHFYLRTDRPSKDGSVPIYIMFTLSRTQRVKFSTDKYIALKKQYRTLSRVNLELLSPEEREDLYCWDKAAERAIKGEKSYESINDFLDAEKVRAKQILVKFELLNKPITLELFKHGF